MTFPNDGTCVIKMKYSEEEISALLAESEQERKRLRKLGKVMETVAPYRLKELQHFQAMEQLATSWRTHGYDRDDSWMHSTRPLSPQQFTASLWSDLQELKDAISIYGRARPWQKAKELLDGLGGDLPDEELAAIKRYVERQSRKAAQVTVTLISTVQHCIPRLLTPEIPPDVCVSLEEKDEEGRMNPEPTELESPSAGTGLETPGQQCPLNGETLETRGTIADGYLLVDMGSNQWGDTSPPTEHVGTRAGTATTPANSSNTIFWKTSRKPEDKDKGTALERDCNGIVFVSEGNIGPWDARCWCFLSVCVFLSALFFVLSGGHFFSELKNTRGDADYVADVRNGRASTFLPINSLKMAKTSNTRFGRIKNVLGYI